MIEQLITKLRAWIDDEGDSTSQGFKYTVSLTFTLALSATAITQVLINGTATSNYTFDSANNTVTITQNMTANDIITVKYTYTNYSDSELTRKLKLAVGDLSLHNEAGKNFEVESTKIYPVPSLKEQNLICKIAFIRIEPNYQEYVTPNLKIKYAKTMDMDEKISALINGFYSGAEFGETMEI